MIWLSLQLLALLELLLMPRQLVFYIKTNKAQNGRLKQAQWRRWNCCEVPQYVCNYVDPSSDTLVYELRITSSGKDNSS